MLRKTVTLNRSKIAQITKPITILNSKQATTIKNELENDRFAFQSSSLFKHAFIRNRDETRVTKRGHFLAPFPMFKNLLLIFS